MTNENNHRRKTVSHTPGRIKETIGSLPLRMRSQHASCPDNKTIRQGWIFMNRNMKMIAAVAMVFIVHNVVSTLSTANDHVMAANIIQDYSDVSSIEDLQKKHALIEDRCYPGMKKVCSCSNPMQPIDRQGQRHWLKASHQNLDAAKAVDNNDIDVVFFGDSIIEGWKGTSYGFRKGNKDGNLSVFRSLFTRDGGGKYEGLLLGISGDTSPNLLWRIQNKELPSFLNPPVIWLLIGLNDIYSHWCSPETTLVGILRVVEELRAQKPGSIIVVNGLLPFSHDKKKGFVKNKRRWGLVHHHKNPPAIWDDIVSINRQLELYCQNKDQLQYFSANDMLLSDSFGVDIANPQIDKNLMSDYVHPSKFGYQLWGDQIMKKLDELISVQE